MRTHEIWVAGRPATFATAGEKPWKALLAAAVPKPAGTNTTRGVRLEFVLPTLAPNGMPLDVDNLCEPLFSAIVNGRGWFDGRRNKIEWWDATKRAAGRDEAAGCWIRFDDSADPGEPESGGLLDAGYHGPLPHSARDEAVHAWAWDLRSATHPGAVPQRANLWLDFAHDGLNLGDIAAGRVKNFIDCFHPLIGGSAGRPDDHRFDRMVITRNVDRALGASVRVRIEALGFVVSGMGPRPGAATLPQVERTLPATSPATRAVQGSRPDSNPCRPGSCKWLVVQASIEGWSRKRLFDELEAVGEGRGANMRQYISDVGSENKIALAWHDGRLIMEI